MSKKRINELISLSYEELKEYIETNREFMYLTLEEERERDRKTMERGGQYWINS